MLHRFIEWAEKNGWNIIPAKEKTELPETVKNRYAVPENWLRFISGLEVCENDGATVWFLTPQDYYPHEGGFQWNEFELMSLEWCDGDSAVTEFWDRHIPIVMSTAGEYSYFAIDTESGSVVHGCEPEFEETDTVADSFEDFMAKVMAGELF